MKKMSALKERMIVFSIINYRLSMNSVYELFGIEDVDDVIGLHGGDNTIKYALKYILNYETINDSEEIQKKAKYKTYSLYAKIKSAKTKEEIYKLLTNPNDKKVLMLNKDARKLTEEEKEDLFEYKYRYALTGRNMESILPYSRHFYRENESKLKNEELKNKLKELNEYNMDIGVDFHSKR